MWIIIGIACFILLIVCVFYILYRRTTSTWPKPERRPAGRRPQPEHWGAEGLYATWIGHSTVLMQIDGIRILTDPVFSRRVGVRILGLTFGPKRHVDPALEPSACTPVDVVLLSHAHMDHLDHPSLRKVISTKTVVVTAEGTSWLVRRHHPLRIHELAPSESVVLECGLEIKAQAVKHWGSRYPWNQHMGYQGYVIRRHAWSVFFAGDTARTDFTSVRKFEPQLALIPIGAYAPYPFENAHCTPEQAWDMFVETQAQRLLPIHHDTFVLSQEPVDEPMRRLLAIASSREQVWDGPHGTTYYARRPIDIQENQTIN
ncbi:L-ascorbate metabolism protein UlaG, beta-lactamase superfamily [Alicyclobacillus hesperidum]|uniref:L-ascorbate metabolism protein UlaG, beta-lactamase superfamily n=1 Tax=Alicyclobacillus hesperidum TaxID=89784 RepID=A0A1H2RL68_9BACL|nr:MBL fold metallo-hydrolase [Alicyclobacillus hesperidum]SDW20151.1 L-ascorbate metabolism protein UlaG, beta-lactamase superfamily [Alicyclobacillus hesperidum]